jgi:hypothetical protein
MTSLGSSPRKPPPANADALILLKDGTSTRWSELSPDAADATYGGDGLCPIEVFAPILPEDGTWQGSVRAQSIEGCAPAVQEMVPGMVAALEFLRQIGWEGKFDPRKLSLDPNTGVVSWTELHPSLYGGQLNAPTNSDILTIHGALSASLVAPDTATATLRLRIGAKRANAEALAALGMADCRTTAVYDFKRVGP